MTRAQLHDIGGRRAWVIWIVAVLVYVLAVFHRSSLGVAGLIATERFEINGTQLAFFTVLQLVVRSEEHTSELQSLMRISYAVFCLKKKKTDNHPSHSKHT